MDYTNCISTTNRALSCRNGIDELFESLKISYPLLSRLCVTVTHSDYLENFHVIDSQHTGDRYDVVSMASSSCLSLMQIIENEEIRIVSDLAELPNNERVRKLRSLGHQSSLTIGIKLNQTEGALLFFNSTQPGYFENGALHSDLLFVKEVIFSLLCHDKNKHQMLLQALKLALSISHKRDPETADHLHRMGLYSKLLAELLAKSQPINHRFIQWIELYAPFHDIGKYRIPDEILFSTKRFTAKERSIMNQHVHYGVDIIDDVLTTIDAVHSTSAEIEFLKNIILCHHERYDGQGYPLNLAHTAIPLEARIVSIADVFDALLSKRAYKPAWPIEKTKQYIAMQTGKAFDPMVVDTLVTNFAQFEAIYRQHPPKEINTEQDAPAIQKTQEAIKPSL
ncbi:HD-GYP domain-containing protein [Vibrio cionasavignyae]|uniref:HD-GYP domain-containing protein n=1 Tax=Vibrio cionasavignyae TaxID=2910252 RepID=UPI003D11ABB8